MSEKQAQSHRSDRSHRFNVNFSDRAYNDLRDLADRTGRTMSEVLRDAISRLKFVDDCQRQGERFMVEKPDGTIRGVEFL